jgi:hypothetical protein
MHLQQRDGTPLQRLAGAQGHTMDVTEPPHPAVFDDRDRSAGGVHAAGRGPAVGDQRPARYDRDRDARLRHRLDISPRYQSVIALPVVIHTSRWPRMWASARSR